MDKYTILIVDDEKDLVSMVKLRLEAAGYDTIEAYNGQEALTKAKLTKNINNIPSPTIFLFSISSIRTLSPGTKNKTIPPFKT